MYSTNIKRFVKLSFKILLVLDQQYVHKYVASSRNYTNHLHSIEPSVHLVSLLVEYIELLKVISVGICIMYAKKIVRKLIYFYSSLNLQFEKDDYVQIEKSP